MREMFAHTPGRLFLLFLLLAIIAMLLVIAFGVLEIKLLLFGFITMPLLVGAVFVLAVLAAYLVYFFKYWPYR